jgi:hypothetical protein
MMFVRRNWLGASMLLAVLAAACSDNNDPSGPALSAPSNVVVTATGANSARITFNAVTGATKYIVERTSGTAAFVKAGETTTTSFDDTGLTPNTDYRYRVAAATISDISAYSSEVTIRTQTAGPTVATISADITSDRTLFSDTVYTLSGFIHVTNGATLTIQPGTKILGDFNTLGSSLFIMRGARIRAMGTAAAPIVFTSSQPVGSRRPGDWGGLIIVGNAQINRTGNIQLEGTNTDAVRNPAIFYSGGTNDADNSGELHYIRVEYAGFAPVTDAELNAFTFAAVGSGTQMDHLQTLAGLDDSFEWFGGTVDGKYFVSYESGDDHFDMSEGYRGRLQFLIAFQSRVLVPRQNAGGASTDPQGIENDGCGSNTGSGCPSGFNSTPLNTPVVANFTLIGRNELGAGSGDLGMVLRRGTGGFYVNGVLGRWARGGISVRDAQTQQRITDGDLQISNILITESPVIYQTGQQAGVDAAANDITLSTSTTTSQFSSLPTLPTATAQLDWTLTANAAARTGGMATFAGRLQTLAGTFITPTAYRGAIDPNGPRWWEGWTYYAIEN